MTKPLQEQAYEYLKNLIEQNELEPGKIYSETQLAKKIAVSRTPFKNALTRLSEDKYIDIIPSKGFRLHTITEKDINDTHQVRIAIEGFCAMELLRNRESALGQLTIRQLAKTIDAMKKMLSSNDLEAFLAADIAFHQQLVSFPENSTFEKLFGTIIHLINQLASKSLMTPNRCYETYDEHMSIFRSIIDGEPEVCYKAVYGHMKKSAEINIRQIRDQKD